MSQEWMAGWFLEAERSNSIKINQSKCKTSNVQNLTFLGHEHQAPDHEATQPMMGHRSMHKLRLDATACATPQQRRKKKTSKIQGYHT
jgi:hypothetical protein